MTAHTTIGEPPGADRQAWHHRANDLAGWTDSLLVNRRDVWGAYYRNADDRIGPVTCPTQHLRGRLSLTREILGQHFEATDHFGVIGLHSGSPSPDCMAKWIAVDFDVHCDDDEPEFVQRFGFHIFDRLAALDLMPLLTTSNGKGGMHLRLIFAQPIPLALAHRLAKWVVRDWADFSLPDAPEAFPKQPRLAPPGEEGEYGNWLRLPGRHPKRDYWSAVWDDRRERWLAGVDAVDAILNTAGVDPVRLVSAVGNWGLEAPAALRNPAPPVLESGGSRYGLVALKREADAVAYARERTRNNTLFHAAYMVGQLIAVDHLDRSGSEMVLTAAARCTGLDDREIAATIRNGIVRGLANPRKSVPA